MEADQIIIHADGGSRGNPGPAAAGIYLEIPAVNLRLLCGKYLGVNTNNFAEYQGVVLGLETSQALLGENVGSAQINFYLDSALIVNQLNGLFRLKSANLTDLFFQVKGLEKNFGKVSYTHVPREKNKEADRAVNKSLDEKRTFREEVTL